MFRFVFACSLMALSGAAFAANNCVRLDVTGTIGAAAGLAPDKGASQTPLPRTMWEDGQGNVINYLPLDFSWVVAGPGLLQSMPQTVKVVNANSYPVTVKYSAMSGCRVGAVAIADSDVHLLYDGSVMNAGAGTMSFYPGNQQLALELDNAMGAAGSVSCAVPGTLTVSDKADPSQTVVLRLWAAGTVSQRPSFVNGAGIAVATASFDFTGSQWLPGRSIESQAFTMALSNAMMYPATVAIIRPSACTIGAYAVANADIVVKIGGTTLTTDSAASIVNDEQTPWVVGFRGIDRARGAVACAVAGTVCYSY